MVEHSVLIIDDDPWIQRVFSRIMIAEGFRKYHIASDGYEGIALALEYHPTIILLDILMPELNGCQILKMIKHIKAIKNIPVIMASAAPNPANISIAIKLGAAGFIVKPFTSVTVHEKLAKVFGENDLKLISEGKELDGTYLQDNFQEEFDMDDMEFELGNFKMKPQEEVQVQVALPDEQAGFKKTGTMNQDALRVHYKTDKENNVKKLDDMLGDFKYKD